MNTLYKNQDSNQDSRIVSIRNPAKSRFQRFETVQSKSPGQTRFRPKCDGPMESEVRS